MSRYMNAFSGFMCKELGACDKQKKSRKFQVSVYEIFYFIYLQIVGITDSV